MQNENGLVINEKQCFFLLWGAIMKQSQNSRKTADSILELFVRIDLQKEIYDLNYIEILNIIKMKTVLHRFPNKMAKFLYTSLGLLNNSFKRDIRNVFQDRNKIRSNLLLFEGIGKHKADICLHIFDCYVTGKIKMLPNNINCAISCEDILYEILILENLKGEQKL